MSVKSKTALDRIYLQDLHVFGSLGQGVYGKVQLVRQSRDTKTYYALKTLRKHRAHEEVALVSSLDSQFVVKCFRLFHTKISSHILMEHCLGGDLANLFDNYYSKFTPAAIRFYCACIVEAFAHIHERKIVYRDLKLENILVDNRGYAKIGDFGLSKKMTGEKTYTMCGTPINFAPELIRREGYDVSADYWSLGVLIYTITAEVSPFHDISKRRVFKRILRGFSDVEFPTHLFSVYVEDIIFKLCKMEPMERLGYHRGFQNDDIRQHKWFRDFDWDRLKDGSMGAPIIPELEVKPALVADCLNRKPEKVKEWEDF